VLANPPLQEAVIVSLERERHEKRTAMPAVVIKATINDRDTLPTALTDSCRLSLVPQGSPAGTGSFWDEIKASRAWYSTPRNQPRSKRLRPR
jgi:hypothetical protein